MKCFYLRCLLLGLLFIPALVIPSVFAQAFVNGDLNGTVAASSAPTSWTQVPFGTPFSLASGTPQATSDVTGLTGPFAGAGINGNPYTGTTLVSGLKVSNFGSFWHEGIRQIVGGFTPGQSYTVTFHQTVVKQSNVQDNSGNWDLFRDNTFVGTSSPTTSTQVYNSNNLPWEQKTITFIATAFSHTLSFMPGDDDTNLNGMNGVRMGIDNIILSPAVILPVHIALQAMRIGNAVQLAWEVPMDAEPDRFFLERGFDGVKFDRIKEMVYAGSSRLQHEDRVPGGGTAYYRLGIRLADGEVVWSEVETVTAASNFAVYVQQRMLHIEAGETEGGQLEIFALSGARMYQGRVVQRLDLGFLPDGIYIVKVRLGGKAQQVVTRKVKIGS